MATDDMFQLDEDERRTSGLAAGSSTSSALEKESQGVDIFRRAMPEVEAEEDVCSICLEEFTQEDPGNSTTCG